VKKIVDRDYIKIAAIDIGSNAVKYKQYRLKHTSLRGHPIELDTFSRISIRLATDVLELGEISEKTSSKLIHELKRIIKKAKKRKVEWIGICATSAMRGAKNSAEICNLIEETTDIKVNVISGIQEAYYLKYTNLSCIESKPTCPLIVDVGGGSTEVLVNSDEVLFDSFDLGGVRCLENKDYRVEWDRLYEWLEKVNHLPVEMLVGIGGNIRSLMKLLNKKKGYPVDKQELKNLLIELEKLSIEEKINQLGLAEDRADVIVPAGKIFLEILDKTSINSVCALEWSLSDAIAFDYYLNNIELFYDYKIA